MSSCRGWSSALVLAFGLGCAAPSCKDEAPRKATQATGRAPAPPAKVALDKARDRVTLLEAALLKLQGEIKVAQDAGDEIEFADLREKEVAIRNSLGSARAALRNTERLTSQDDAGPAAPVRPSKTPLQKEIDKSLVLESALDKAKAALAAAEQATPRDEALVAERANALKAIETSLQNSRQMIEVLRTRRDY